MELSEIATPFIPRKYTEELLDCERYLKKIPRLDVFLSRANSNASVLYVPIPLRTPLRIKPTIILSNPSEFAVTNQTTHITSIPDNNVINYDMTDNTITLRMTNPNNTSFKSNLPASVTYLSTTPMLLDAEIY
ncbi:MAG: hypothetical protein NC218_09325 [Acetobacter sp.]|nr:hypothetical protein [Acetobacter sp.]